MEIERKFLLAQLPEIVSFEVASIEQAYISIDPEVRIRKKTILKGKDKGKTDYKLTVKSSGTLAREEFETSVTKEFYENTLAFIGKPPITKFYEKYYRNGIMLRQYADNLDLNKVKRVTYDKLHTDAIPSEDIATMFGILAVCGRKDETLTLFLERYSMSIEDIIDIAEAYPT